MLGHALHCWEANASWPRTAPFLLPLLRWVVGPSSVPRLGARAQSKAFSERLEAAIARYHTNAITTAQILEELIQLAKDIRAARARGEETGLSDEEIAFYDALAENESARQVMGEPTLRVIAHELVTVIKNNVSVDWMHKDLTRARICVHVKRLLRKYGYPPDLQDAAVQNVLQQAEALSAEWAA